MDLENKAIATYKQWIGHLKEAREKAGQKKQSEIAEALKQTVAYVNKFENAKVLPSVKTLFMYLLVNKFDLNLLSQIKIHGTYKPADQVRKDFIKKIKKLDEDSLLYLFEMSEIAEKLKSASIGSAGKPKKS